MQTEAGKSWRLNPSLRRSLYQLLREGNVKEFNQRKTQGEKLDLTSCDFRYLDLRGLAAAGSDFTGCYFRAADLRGVDFSKACPAVQPQWGGSSAPSGPSRPTAQIRTVLKWHRSDWLSANGSQSIWRRRNVGMSYLSSSS
jgi:uncharacterized protein YjbI with pentapeptide repeats